MYEDKTPEAIKAEILAAIRQSQGLSAMAGGFADGVAGPVAEQLSEAYRALEGVPSMLFVDESSGGYIDLVGGQYYSITRREGTRAYCDMTFNGAPGLVIPKGTAFLTAGGLAYSLLAAVTLGRDGAGEGRLEAAEAGSVLYYPPHPNSDIAGYHVPVDRDGEELVGKTPMQIRRVGVSLAFVPEDRLGMGLVAGMDMVDNMMLKTYREHKGPFVDRKAPRALAQRLIDELEIVTPGVGTPVRRLSGGNVQKVLVGREIDSTPTVLMTAYPVRGLDINSSYTIYGLLNQQKMKGVAVLLVGEDLDVLLELCDRILVLCGGKVSGIVDGRNTTKEEVGLYMTHVGGGKEAGERA